MNREQAMSFIEKSQKFGSKLGLERITKLCELLGNPQDKLKYIHIAGTNGKGSTSVFINNILCDAGYKVGLYTSPFIYKFNERIQINNIAISDFNLTEIMTEIAEKIDEMLKTGYEHPTEFEIITAAAFLYFEKEKCDYVVLEVGLGGTYDATNIIKNAILSVITSISLDHTDYLGDTLPEIAKNKCGIIKESCPVLCYMNQAREVIDVVEDRAKEMQAELVIADIASLRIKECSISGNKFFYNGCDYETTLLGKYQIYNAIIAINAAEILKKSGIDISLDNVKNGVKKAKWPARFEILSHTPTIIADGSHNADGMNAFVTTAKEILRGRPICIFGMLKDKNYGFCLKKLSEITDTIIITEVDNPRRETVENLSVVAKKYIKNVYLKKNNQEAMSLALALANNDDTIIALGSLYMMNNIKNSIKAKN